PVTLAARTANVLALPAAADLFRPANDPSNTTKSPQKSIDMKWLARRRPCAFLAKGAVMTSTSTSISTSLGRRQPPASTALLLRILERPGLVAAVRELPGA